MIRNVRQVGSIRCFHRTVPRSSFLGDWFSSKKKVEDPEPLTRKVNKEKKDIIKDQDNFEIDPKSKIVFMNKNNSPNHDRFRVSTHMPDFHIHQWKNQSISLKQAYETYTSEKLAEIINDTLRTLDSTRESVSPEQFKQVSLEDLKFRFEFAKLLQKNLGIDIPDLILTQSHDLQILFDEVNTLITSRFKNERNPNDINLQQADFTAPNVFINNELSEFEQAREFEKLVKQARDSL